MDASEVENLSVLKDGASAAIYGSRAANGVILVTTKKGKIGKPTINYTGSVGISDATKIPEVFDTYRQALYTNDALRHARRSKVTCNITLTMNCNILKTILTTGLTKHGNLPSLPATL